MHAWLMIISFASGSSRHRHCDYYLCIRESLDTFFFFFLMVMCGMLEVGSSFQGKTGARNFKEIFVPKLHSPCDFFFELSKSS